MNHKCKPIHALLLSVGLYLTLSSAHARPEYAVKNNSSCVTCHTTPWGGGPRNVFGKVFGSHGYALGKHSATDLYYGDIRALAFFPEKPTNPGTKKRSGLALMKASAAANVPITGEPGKAELRAVLSYSFGVLASGLNEAYVRWQITRNESAPIHILVGRFYSPFGLLTDEHRTFTKSQVPTSLNDYEMGGAISLDFLQSQFHWDFAITNGFQSGGSLTNQDLTYGLIGNLRWQPPYLPFFLGASGKRDRTLTNKPSPYAVALYGALSLDRLTDSFIPGSIQVETVLARHWNDPDRNSDISCDFSETANFIDGVVLAQSIGWYAMLNIDLSTKLILRYKFESLALNRQFPSDSFLRHGVGLKYFLSSNTNILVRVEKAQARRPGIEDEEKLGSQDSMYGVLRIWL